MKNNFNNWKSNKHNKSKQKTNPFYDDMNDEIENLQDETEEQEYIVGKTQAEIDSLYDTAVLLIINKKIDL